MLGEEDGATDAAGEPLIAGGDVEDWVEGGFGADGEGAGELHADFDELVEEGLVVLGLFGGLGGGGWHERNGNILGEGVSRVGCSAE